jgi:bacillithiol system protein YtxJ
MNWLSLNTEEQIEDIKKASFTKPIAIFKHSTRCSISTMAKGRLERAEQPQNLDFYYLDLLAYRPISNKIAETFAVPHQSPQILLIKDGECTYEETHNGINMDELITQL